MIEATEIQAWDEEKLVISRNEMTEHLALFFTHVRYTLTLMLTLFTASSAILGFGLKVLGEGNDMIPYVVLSSSVVLFMVFVVSWFSRNLVERYYKLYASSYVYSARIHDLHSLKTHPWMLEIKNRVRDIHSDEAVSEFLADNIVGERHSWSYYKGMIQLIGLLSLTISVLMVFCFFYTL